MRKILILSAMLGAMVFAVPSVEAKSTSSAAADPQINVRFGQPRGRWNNRPIRTVTRTRITRVGRYRYRETIRITYYRNGRTRTQVISRVRLGGRNW
jgi:hypothetical protein